uniref:ABC transmembrane type-1 domain-containing protein n=1 Tax=Panagrolaimus sp. PS1159 TaxID=55785 RepID=A0AC35F3C5_9BILA
MGDGKKDDSDDDRDAESIERDLLSPDQPTSNMTLASKDIRESVRQSFQRDFLASDHVGDAETEAYNIELEKSGHTRTSFAQIFLDARELWPLLSVALGVCFFNALAMPVNAFIYGQAFQMFEDGRRDNVGEAFIFFLFFVGLGVVALIASFCTTYLFGKIGEKLTMSMRVRAFRSIIYQDGSYFDNPAHTPGKLITRLATDAPNVKAAMDTRLARVAQGILALLAAVVISVFMDWKFALTCSMAFVFLGIFQFTIAKMAHSQAVKFAQSDEAGRIAIEAIENVRTIQLLTSEHSVHNSFTFCSLKRQKAEMRKAPIEALNFATTHGLQYFTLAFCYMMGFIFVVNGWTYKVTLFQVVQTIYFGAIAVIQATEFFPEFVKSRLAASLMYAIINRQPRTGKIDAGEKISIEGD